MDKKEISNYLLRFEAQKERTIVMIDYGNVEKWKNSLRWIVGIKELAQLVKKFSLGKQFLRRFYYGSDYGPDEKSKILVGWSKGILEMAEMNRLEIATKRVKYIRSNDNKHGFEKKCDLDVEMAIDLIRERDNYDTAIIFSGDGDLMCAAKYIKETYGKIFIVFGARNHIGREVFDAMKAGIISNILYAEDFEYRLSKNRFNP
jgi:uncharacterized LabA/DUF88 family protein